MELAYSAFLSLLLSLSIIISRLLLNCPHLRNPDYDKIDQEEVLEIVNLPELIQKGHKINIINKTKNEIYSTEHLMSERQVNVLLLGSLINTVKRA